MSPLRVSNFSPIEARIRALWRILQSVRNEDEEGEKTKKLKRILFACISEMAGAIFFEFGM